MPSKGIGVIKKLNNILPRKALLRDHNGNKAYKLLFLRNAYHQLSAIKDIVSFYC